MCNNFVGTVRAYIQVSSDDTADETNAETGIRRDGKLQPATKLSRGASGGVMSSSATDLETASAGSSVTPSKNGASVISGRERQTALDLLSKLCRALKTLGLYNLYRESLSQMISSLQQLK